LKQKSNLLPPSFARNIIKADTFKYGGKTVAKMKAEGK
jgi:hypothetical protein